MNGVFLIDKPAGMTSHDVVDRVRKIVQMRRVGHTGTLDPAATGLLLICVGKATRLSEHLTGLDKTYEGEMHLGVTTDSYDMDGEILEEKAVPETSVEALQAICDTYTGAIEQVPPMVSAVKVDGERLYKKARKGLTVERKARQLTVHAFDVLSYDAPKAQVRVCCTSGTYVRSLCHDVGQQLGCGGALSALRRSQVGKFDIADAITLDALREVDTPEDYLIPMRDALELPAVIIHTPAKKIVQVGGALSPSDLRDPAEAREGWVQIKDIDGELLALGLAECTAMGVGVQPKRVFME